MKVQLKKQEMVVGKEYKGYAWRNEYGEFFFRPYAEGSRAGRVKKICEGPNYSVSTTSESVIVHMRLKKVEGRSYYVQALGNILNELINVFLKYEI